ncbi:N4-bis(aminopropyl)spermidine synthase [Vibrio crassostreae]|nr:N4-bis(aminopropyl)spermidine synthase [Vibrio crassostreae]CAK2803222.1 N4-bis(aminopropyl)spermidine synthase [Vibrio crassostreae]CAK3293043.1 N4-bis(aminopropyl)spermidine synthase [Vibrio crassostreae]CAK3846536.1 N4-bis(aminopropyl)spermidine synthase [Vibrio crassostreae]
MNNSNKLYQEMERMGLNQVDNSINVKSIEKLLGLLDTKIDIRHLLYSELSVSAISWLILYLIKNDCVRVEQENGVSYLSPASDISSESNLYCDYHVINLNRERYLKEIEYIEKLILSKRKFKTEYYQNRESLDGLIRRYEAMMVTGDHQEDNTLILGDDAMFSIFLSLRERATKIKVLDIDQDLVNLINEVSKELNLIHLSADVYDVRYDLPNHIKGKFDTFFVSGWKDVRGLSLFLARALNSLKQDDEIKCGYFIYGDHQILGKSQHQYYFDIQKKLNEFGCAITQLLPCTNTWVSDCFINTLIGEIEKIVHVNIDMETAWVHLSNFLTKLPEMFKEEGWLQLSRFPLIQLAPTKVGRVSVKNHANRSIDIFLKLVELNAAKKDCEPFN